uniref:Uncharacterized protein n=1 Tax=Ditylenchus dipsaci TaxID=166011 RepID=A0A915E0A1_9BILA
MPARVVDLRMRVILESEFPVDKALQTKPAGDHHLLVVLFDLQGSWKWLPTNRLKPCDLIMNCKEGGPSKARSRWGKR